jgi:prephenate dehydratase
MKKIAYLGPVNTYSYLAAQSAAADGDKLIPCQSFSEVFDFVKAGKADTAVVPMENSVEGNVNEVTDFLIFGSDNETLYINSELVLSIDNFLIAKLEADFNKIETVFTHWQPYAQCRGTVNRLLPNVKIVFAESTAAATEMISDEKTAAIGGKQLLKNGFKLSEFSVNDIKNNTTRFCAVSLSNKTANENDKLTVVFEAENKPGGLVRLLEIFHAFGMNMTRLESRPHKSVLGRYVFIADITGNILDKDTSSALELIKRSTVFFKMLGNYKSKLPVQR